MKRIYFTLLFLLFIISRSHAQAVIAGADLTYTCTSTPGVFEISLVLYRPCNTTPLCPGSCGSVCDQTVEIWGAENGFENTQFTSATLNLNRVFDVISNPRCWNQNIKNTCDNMGCVTPGTYSPAYEQYIFKGMVNLGPTSGIPANCCMVRLIWDDGVRDNNQQTIITPQTFYTDASINRCLSVSPCNSSPENTSMVTTTACQGENFIYNIGMIDPDYDSLSFAFAPALASYNTPVTYVAPYAFNKPMPWIGNANGEFPAGIRCDAQTGDVLFTPDNSGNSNITGVIVVECKQWKKINGVYTIIGITRRDMNLTTLANCPANNPPRFITVPSQGANPNAPKTQWEFCSGQPNCFTISARDTDFLPPTLSDTTYLTWNAALAPLGATFKPLYVPSQRGISGPREDVYQFCWTPHDSLVKTVPYYFTVEAKDDRCFGYNPGTVTKSFSIKVNQGSKLIDTISIVPTDSGCGRYYFSVQNKLHPHNLYFKSLRIAHQPNDKGLIHGATTYNYSSPQMHIFNDTGLFYIRYSELNSMSSASCKGYLEHVDSIYITQTHQIEDSVQITQPTCSTPGKIEVFPINSSTQYTFALNNFEFGSQSLFDSLLPNTYSLYVKDTTGCIKSHTITLNAPPRLIPEITSNNYSWNPNDTVLYTVTLAQQVMPTYQWSVQNGTLISGQGTTAIKVVWGHLSGVGLVNVSVSSQSCIDSAQFETYWLTNGLSKNTQESAINLFPNPTHNLINIDAAGITNETVQIFDMHGKLLHSEDASNKMQLNLSNFANGIYLIKIGRWKSKVVKEN